jgi:hypothetical protein
MHAVVLLQYNAIEPAVMLENLHLILLATYQPKEWMAQMS